MKNRKANDDEIRPDVRQLVRSLTNTLRGLEIANADAALLLAYQRLLANLSTGNTGLLNALFGECSSVKRDVQSARSSMSDDEIAQLSDEDVEKLLESKDAPKAQLAQIATIRFSVTKGAVSKLSKEALRLKLQSLIENEKTHQAIGRAARSSS